MYLIVWRAIQWDADWKEVYERLVARKCHLDERTRRLVGWEKVIGRLAGQMASVIFVLLKKDQELLAHLALGATPPEPQLSNAALHRQHRMGHYQPSKSRKTSGGEIRLSSDELIGEKFSMSFFKISRSCCKMIFSRRNR